ncbi:MAG: hypothetical protein FGM32_01840 [Candidatus Kapabacteria bacterium]|nr:hypothetical protein [Candidatus Kapabacteria bacterium]
MNIRIRLISLMVIPVAGICATSQTFSTSQIDNKTPNPMVISNRSSNALPLRITTGPSMTRALEIGQSGNTWLLGPLGIGNGVGTAPFEAVRIGSLAASGGRGLTITLDATSTATGLLVRDVGNSGSNDAGIVISSQSNGMGTGLRIGGPTGTGRPTLGTGIDVTGGTGIRYNALTAGNGVAIDIGGSTPPRRGMEITASGSQHIGLVARANTTGMGIIGVSQSSSYETLPFSERTGVRGHAATNSGIGADTIIGVMGTTQRGGSGSTQIVSIGVVGNAETLASGNAGTTLGIYGTATSAAAGVAVAIGGGFRTDTGQIALLTIGGDVILGGERPRLPPIFQMSTFREMPTRNRTYVHHLLSSGMSRFSGVALTPTPNIILPAAIPALVTIGAGSVIRLQADVNGSVVGGIRTDAADRLLTLVVTQGNVTLVSENPNVEAADRLRLKNGVALQLGADDMIQLWYDQEIQRWRCYSF